MVAALNDVYGLNIALDLMARDVNEWATKYPHLASRSDITLRGQDVRNSFELPKRTTLVIHAAGIPNNRVHSSDPLRVYQTTVDGINNTLDAAAKLDGLRRFVNVSSCLVAGTPTRPGPLRETDYFPIPAGALHSVYIDAKRAAESLAAIYRSQFRLPISTVRLFTLSGAYQELDRPWAMNSFFHDVLDRQGDAASMATARHVGAISTAAMRHGACSRHSSEGWTGRSTTSGAPTS